MGVMLMPDSSAAMKGEQNSTSTSSLLNMDIYIEIFRILRPEGICAFSTWQTVGWIPDVRAALATIPGAPPFPDDETFMSTLSRGAPWHRPAYVEEQLAVHGFKDDKVEVMTSLPSVDNPAVYAEMFSRMIVGFMASLIWSNEDREKYADSVKPALLGYMTKKYGEGQRIEWDMAAIVATARKP